ncbi:MAG: RNA 2',3'-cyclic phosphodiesterase [Candidatus Thermoplasmatota archaeon]|nr:RNA 2',3'-cyclic phosphodiesterase [Candidatus Thermoplasmatota archaeon]
MRCFIGMHVPEPVEILNLLAGIDSRKFRATDMKNIHLTLFFLGEIDEERAGEICAFLKGNVFEDLVVKPSRIIGLPSAKHARIVALVIDNMKLTEYHDRICSSLNLHEDREFIPHITIARAKYPVNIEEWIRSTGDPVQTIQLEKPALYKSTLTQLGPVHEKICQSS